MRDPADSEQGPQLAPQPKALAKSRYVMQKCYAESFNGRMRDEPLNEKLSLSLGHARVLFAAWAND